MSCGRVILAGFYPPPFAGEPIHVKQLAGLLRDRGLRVEVLNLNRHALPSTEYRSAPGRLGILQMLYRFSNSTSILHLHTNGHSWRSWIMIIAAALAVRLTHAQSLVTLHSGLLPGYVHGLGPMRRWLARRSLRCFSRIICVNREIASAVGRLAGGRPEVHVIPAFLGVDRVPQLSEQDGTVISKFKPLVVTVAGGEHDPETGLAVVVRALPSLREIWPTLGAVFVGWQTGVKTNSLIGVLGLSSHAVCLGEVSHERCLALLNAADVVVRSTFADGDAITVREAMALGVPVVASDTDFRPDAVTLFHKGDTEDLVAKLTATLIHSPPTASKCGGEDSFRDLWQIYSQLLGAHLAKPSRTVGAPGSNVSEQ